MSIRRIVGADGRGLALRLRIDETANKGFLGLVKDLIEGYGLKPEDCDLILDLEAPNFDPMDGFVNILEEIIRVFPNLDRWRRLVLIGTSFPSTMAIVGLGASIIPRSEWSMYKMLASRLAQLGVRVPCFGDYAINHPEVPTIDMRIVKPSASIRYTVDDGWLLVKGKNVRDNGFDQYRDLCSMVVGAKKYYRGWKFSKGDEYIYKCSQGQASTGNLTTWRWVGTNHHLEMVAQDVVALGVV